MGPLIIETKQKDNKSTINTGQIEATVYKHFMKFRRHKVITTICNQLNTLNRIAYASSETLSKVSFDIARRLSDNSCDSFVDLRYKNNNENEKKNFVNFFN